ncbi:MAG: glycosyltransferase family 39 protein, partial [Armatimonadota bacterium]|nr:glycosyltransferase family 39 protein [Armatimonadota bacterium]
MMSERFWRYLQSAALLLFAATSLTMALTVPHGGMPDEDGHANYVRAIATGQGLPLARSVTGVVATEAADGGQPLYASAQAHHPPTYYALVAAIYGVSGRNQSALFVGGRVLGVLLGILSLLLTRSAVLTVLPQGDKLAAVGMLICAASPTFTFIMGSLNNETLAVAIVCLGTWLAAPVLASGRMSMVRAGLLGAALGLALVVKLTAVVVFVPVALAFVAFETQNAPPSHIHATQHG